MDQLQSVSRANRQILMILSVSVQNDRHSRTISRSKFKDQACASNSDTHWISLKAAHFASISCKDAQIRQD
ncbi:hypothetical protein JQ615_15740 [Bradyrhizobium jicamae]|uniref:Uncharacterized protein n=1 Tax=Bradyrhizobium jicamae TaxID=280332 RepID=A0ABS5FJA1_9BRAD|nr:hypothetical protein [Bradyrhizobium jicamae]MBR0796848.1 hypothetical protein [Bradyrhizobium jicamae]MBR0935283.1 hypothetical protein [Bradyrhizobium jicamae]